MACLRPIQGVGHLDPAPAACSPRRIRSRLLRPSASGAPDPNWAAAAVATAPPSCASALLRALASQITQGSFPRGCIPSSASPVSSMVGDPRLLLKGRPTRVADQPSGAGGAERQRSAAALPGSEPSLRSLGLPLAMPPCPPATLRPRGPGPCSGLAASWSRS